jgi:hypothetical protein
MASPFRFFRKHQKALLVVAGVILILVFVISDSLPYLTGGSRSGGGDPEAGSVAVTWDGGSLTNRQLDALVMQRRILNSFLERIHGLGAESAYRAGVEPRQLHVQILRGPDTPQQGVEQSVVNTRIFADAARDAGMHVSNETLVQYLYELGRGNVTNDDMRAILKSMQTGVTIDYILDALREEMLARNYINSHQFALETVTPDQRFADWRRVNDHVVLEAAALPIEKFEVDVPKPTDEELAAFFDKYKSVEASPVMYFNTELPSATPGFAISRKIDVQFIAANYDEFLKKVEGEITDEEIAKYYEENKDPLFIKADTKLMDEKKGATSPTTEDAKDSGSPPSETQTAPESESTTVPQSPGPDASQPENDKQEPANEGAPASESKAAPETPADDAAKPEAAPSPETENQQPAKADEAPPADGKQSSLNRSSRIGIFRLVGFQENADETGSPADDAAPPAANSGEAASANEKDSAAKSESPAEGTPPADSAPGAAASDTVAPAAPAPPADPPAAPPTTTPPAAEKDEKPKEFQPLDEVRDQIRRQLASARATEQLTKLMENLEGEINDVFQKYFSEVLTAQDEEKKPPAPPASLADLTPLAEKHGLKAGQTGPMSALQLRETPVGKSGVAESGISLLGLLFGTRDLELYQPVSTMDVDGNRYIAMKISDTPGKVPTLAEVRNDVVKAWTRMKAAELAEKNAQEIAKKVQESKSKLADYFADDQSVKVATTDPFAELTGGDVGFIGGRIQRQPFRLNQPEGILAPGPEFMKKTFELKDGEVGAVLNNDRSIAYVIRVVNHEPPVSELQTAYLGEANTWPGQFALTNSHAQEAGRSFVNDIIGESGIKWEGNHPDKIEQDEPESGKQEGG